MGSACGLSTGAKPLPPPRQRTTSPRKQRQQGSLPEQRPRRTSRPPFQVASRWPVQVLLTGAIFTAMKLDALDQCSGWGSLPVPPAEAATDPADATSLGLGGDSRLGQLQVGLLVASRCAGHAWSSWGRVACQCSLLPLALAYGLWPCGHFTLRPAALFRKSGVS